MKQIQAFILGITSAFSLASLFASCTPQAAEGFTIRSEIPGLPDGTRVRLLNIEDGRRDSLTCDTVRHGTFQLEGRVASPTLCWLLLDKEIPDGKGGTYQASAEVELMVENTQITVVAPHFDSIPAGWSLGSDALKASRHVAVKGGKAQREFSEYRTFMFPFEAAVKDRHRDWVYCLDGQTDADPARTEQAYKEAQQREEEARSEFIRLHPSYSISGYLMCQKLEGKFQYTDRQLDSIARMMATGSDTARLSLVNRAISESRHFVKGKKYTDFEVLDTDSTACNLSDRILPERYTLVDFWASWCGPCRASIPHVRSLCQTYQDRLTVLSLSVDSKREDWLRALQEEQMEWTQLLVPRRSIQQVQEEYQLRGIPYLLLIDPQGGICYAGHDSHEVTVLLEELLDCTEGR